MQKTLTWIFALTAGAAAIYFVIVLSADAAPKVPLPEIAKPVESRPAPGGNHGAPVIGESAGLKLNARAGARPDAISGVVRDAGGAVVADADVEFFTFEYRTDLKVRIFEQSVRVVLARTVTNGDGVYEILLPAGRNPAHPGSLWCAKAGFVAQTKHWIAFGTSVDFKLTPGCPVVGIVTDGATTAPVANAMVRGWFATTGVSDADVGFQWQEDVRTNAKGEYRFEGAPEGVVKFLVFHDDYYDFWDDRTLVRGVENRVDLVLKRGVVVAGIVRDSVTRKPIEGVEVSVSSILPIGRRFATTDAEGRFRAPGLEAGPALFNFAKRGYSRASMPRTVDAKDDEASGGAPIVFDLPPAGGIAGIVRRRDGTPVANASVFVAELRQVFWVARGGVAPEAVTDAGGKYLVTEIPPGATHKIVVVDADMNVAEGADVVVDPGVVKDGTDVVMPRPAGIVGRISDENGSAVAGATITVRRPQYFGVTFPPGSPLATGGLSTVASDAEGRYRFSGLWRGDHKLTVDHPDFVLVDGVPVKIAEDEEIVTHDVALFRGGTILGRVVDASGSPVGGARVSAYAPIAPDAIAGAVTGEDGTYALTRLRSGEYSVKAKSASGDASSAPALGIATGATGVDFTLLRNPTVFGYVTDQSGRPVSKYRLVLTSIEAAGMAPRTKPSATIPRSREYVGDDEAGLFKIENVEPGGYVAELKADGLAPTRARDLMVEPNVDLDLGPLVLRTGGVLSGRVVDDRGAPVAEADVLLARVGGGPIPVPDPVKTRSGETYDATFGGKTDADGRFRIIAVSQGQYLLRVDSAAHLQFSPVQVVLVDGEEEAMSLELRRAGSFTVFCVDDDGTPVSNGIVEVRDLDGRLIPPGKGGERIGRSDANGKCELPRLPLGTVLIRGRKAGMVSKEVSVNVLEGSTGSLTLKLQRDAK